MFVRALSILVAAAAALGIACAPRPSVDVRLPAEAPGSVLIQNVAVLDVERGVMLPGRDVSIERGRIAAIKPTGRIAAPEGAQVVSGAGATLVPGLVDMHGHIYTDPAPTWASGFPDPEANLRSYLYSGVTTVLDPADSSGAAFERRAQVASGELPGPRIFTAGRLLTCPDGHPIALVKQFAPSWIAWYLVPRAGVAIDSGAAAAAVDMLAAEGADVVKVVIDRIPLDSPRISADTVRAVVERARSHGLRVVAHIGTTEDALDAAEAGVAAWMHGVYKERIPDAQVAALASYGIPMVATVEVFDRYGRAGDGPRVPTRLEQETVPPDVLAAFYPPPEDFELGALQSWVDLMHETREARIDNVRRMHEAGVTILAGSDAQSGVFPGPALHRELHHLVRAGFTPAEAIRAATLDSARFLADGAEPEFGAVAVGKRADLLLVEGDPSADVGALGNIRQVFLGGVALERTPLAVDHPPDV